MRMKKNLVYFSVFYNRDYFRLATLLVESMRLFSSTDQFDLLIMTSPEFLADVQKLRQILPMKVLCIPLTTIFQAACARLRIFGFSAIDDYDKILYLDTDIIIKKDLAPLFDLLPPANLLYGLASGTIASPSFGCQFFDFTVFDSETKGLNSGTLMFHNCDATRDLFARTLAHIEVYPGTPPYCMDQPFINYHAIKDGLYDNTWIAPHVSLYEDEDAVTNYETSAICHFSFPIGNWSHKFGRMSVFFKDLLTANDDGVATTRFVGESFTWGASGFIHFGPAGKLETTWGTGTYESIGSRVRATWMNHSHILTFSPDSESYASIRIQPLDFDWTTGVVKS